MKRFLLLIVALSLIVTLFSGCGVSSLLLTLDNDREKEDGSIIQFASSYYCDLIAVLYADGTVGIASAYDLDPYLPVLEWKNVKKIWINAGILIALHEDGTVSCITPSQEENSSGFYSTDHLKNVVDVCFLEPNSFFLCLLEDGSVEYVGQGHLDRNYFQHWTNVKKLVSFGYSNMFAIFRDGTIADIENAIPQEELPFWTDIQDVSYNGTKYFGIKEDGSIIICDTDPEYSLQIPNETYSLADSRELYHAYDVSFGLTDSGDLLVSGGKDWFCDVYAQKYDLSLVNFSEFTDIKQLELDPYFPFSNHTVALRNDGTVVALDQKVNGYVSQWTDVVKLVSSTDYYGNTLICGLQSDGNVIALEIFSSGDVAHHSENFLGWNVEDIYAHPIYTVVGFCADGSIVTPYPSSIQMEVPNKE